VFTQLGRLGRAALVAATMTLASASIPAAASATTTTTTGCEPKASAPVFAPWGDLRDYYLAPGGAFEGGISWAQSGAVSLAPVNEPWLLAGVGHTSAARLGVGGAITSPKQCMTLAEPDVRFFARHLGGAQLDVTVRLYAADGRLIRTAKTTVAPGDHLLWAPTELVDLKTDVLEIGETGHVDLTLASQGTWLVDDVFVDPYRR